MEVEKDKSREETSNESKKNETKDHTPPPTKYGTKKGRFEEENFNQETSLPFHSTYSPIVQTTMPGGINAQHKLIQQFPRGCLYLFYLVQLQPGQISFRHGQNDLVLLCT
jgi:hypothetical protein